MKLTLKLLAVFSTVLILTCCSTNKIIKQTMEVRFSSIDNNVCKKLKGKVVLYAIFVDTRYTHPWSEYDINSTLDSIRIAMNWIEQKAKKDSLFVDIQIDYHKTNQGKVPIAKDFTNKTLSATLFRKYGIKNIYRWADNIASTAGRSLPKDTSKVVTTKNTLRDRERLIARLRDIHKTDNIALIYFINNYYKDEISAAFDTNSNNSIEFSIVSFKNSGVIAHEFLHLFGAWDLYINPFEKSKKQRKKEALAIQMFPNEVMAFPYRKLDSLNISPFTKYTLGWDNELDEEYRKLVLGDKLKPLKY